MKNDSQKHPKITTRLSATEAQKFAKLAIKQARDSVGVDGWNILVPRLQESLILSHVLTLGLGWDRYEEIAVSCLQQIVDACSLDANRN